jgi:hypothetical protein
MAVAMEIVVSSNALHYLILCLGILRAVFQLIQRRKQKAQLTRRLESKFARIVCLCEEKKPSDLDSEPAPKKRKFKHS